MTVKHLVGIAIATAVAIASAGAVGIGAVEHSATQVLTKRLTPSKAEFRLNDHQQLRKMLLGQEHIVLRDSIRGDVTLPDQRTASPRAVRGQSRAPLLRDQAPS